MHERKTASSTTKVWNGAARLKVPLSINASVCIAAGLHKDPSRHQRADDRFARRAVEAPHPLHLSFRELETWHFAVLRFDACH
jgi:hypothetical protein